MTLKEAYNYSVYFLAANNIDESEFKALCLVCSVAGISNSDYAKHENDTIMMKPLADLLWQVKDGEPLQYVLGEWDFYNSTFFVGDGVLIPRPETEELTHMVVEAAKLIKSPVVLDLCAGSGCIGISIAKEVPSSEVYLIEKSDVAYMYLEKNSKGVQNVHPYCGDITDFAHELPIADIIVSNPPYIKTDVLPILQAEVKKEPMLALDGGADGLEFYRVINDKWYDKINHGGQFFLEIGEDQGKEVKEILTNFSQISVLKDIYGNDRMVHAIKS